MNLAKEVKDNNLTMVVFFTDDASDWIDFLGATSIETPREYRTLALSCLQLADEMKGL